MLSFAFGASSSPLAGGGVVHSCGALARKLSSGLWQGKVSWALEHSVSDLCVSCLVLTQALLETALPLIWVQQEKCYTALSFMAMRVES